MANNKNYMSNEDLPNGMYQSYNEAEALKFKVDAKTEELNGLKANLKELTDKFVDFLNRKGFNGIDAEKSLLYLRASSSVPSFKAVLESIEDELPKTVVQKLNDRYKELVKNNGEIAVIKRKP